MEHHVATIDVGTPPKSSHDETKTAVFCFHNFESLSAPKGEYVESGKISAFGHKWSITLYPRGTESPEGSNAEGVGVFLNHRMDSSIDIKFSIGIVGLDDEEVRSFETSHKFTKDSFGCPILMSRANVVKHLHEGTLRFKLRIEKNDLSGHLSSGFAPKNPLPSAMLDLLADKESADVVFEFDCGEDNNSNGRKKLKTLRSLHAHRIILEKVAPQLAALCESSKETVVVPTKGESMKVFRLLLHYTYGGKLTEKEMRKNSRSLIDAADKYGLVNLKLDAEQWYVKLTAITVDNVLDNLLYADSKNCALLKEAVMDFFVENGHQALRKVSVKDVPGNMFADLLTAVARGKPEKEAEKEGTKESPDFSIMRVNKLRAMCQKKGLEVDGSRESLIAALESATKGGALQGTP